MKQHLISLLLIIFRTTLAHTQNIKFETLFNIR